MGTTDQQCLLVQPDLTELIWQGRCTRKPGDSNISGFGNVDKAQEPGWFKAKLPRTLEGQFEGGGMKHAGPNMTREMSDLKSAWVTRTIVQPQGLGHFDNHHTCCCKLMKQLQGERIFVVGMSWQ